MFKGEVHTRVCLQVLGSITAYVEKKSSLKLFVAPQGATQSLINST